MANVVDYGFYLIQRGEAGHTRGAYLNEYKDCGGIETIGYGTVTRPGYNDLNYRNKTVTEEQAVELAKQEMAHKINEKCRSKFKDYDNLLPCYQAVILDTTYQGNWGAIQDAMNAHDMQAVYQAIIQNPNHERAAVRGRAIEMGMLVEQALAANPNADPKMVAQLLAQQMIEQYAYLNGTDCELTKDELALLYRSCMAAYGREVSEEEIEAFALSFNNVASGMCGIGSGNMAPAYTGSIPAGPSYDGSRSGGVNQGYVRDREVNSTYRTYGDGQSGPQAPMPFVPAEIGPNRFEPDSKVLEVSTSDVSGNFSGRGGKKPKMIVLHTTESYTYGHTKSTFQSRGDNPVSAHYVIDRDGTIHQYLPEGYSAWHAGKSNYPPLGISGCCNADSIGIEIQRAPGEALTPEQIASTKALVNDIQQRQGIAPEHTVFHSDIAPGRKGDPGDDFPLDGFVREGLMVHDRNHPHPRTGAHTQHINPALNDVNISDCKYYKKAEAEDHEQAVAEEEYRRKVTDGAYAQQAATSKTQTSVDSSLQERLRMAEENGKDESRQEEGEKSSDEPKKETKSDKKSGGKGKSKHSSKSGSDKKDDKKEESKKGSSKEEVVAPKVPLGENITNKKDPEEEGKKSVQKERD